MIATYFSHKKNRVKKIDQLNFFYPSQSNDAKVQFRLEERLKQCEGKLLIHTFKEQLLAK